MQEIFEILDDLSLIIHSKIEGKLPRYKQYLSASRGVLYQDIWAFKPGTRGLLWNSKKGIDEDVKWLDNEPEHVDYPTQKPLGLLSRIIRSSSNEGDMVLDPFCGCATTPVAAEKLNRQWVGIDISPKAAELVKVRMERETNLLDQFNPIVRTDIPKRTDVGKLPPYKTHRHTLYGKQEGYCAGCKHHFPFRNLTVDHIVAKSRGGRPSGQLAAAVHGLQLHEGNHRSSLVHGAAQKGRNRAMSKRLVEQRYTAIAHLWMQTFECPSGVPVQTLK